MASVAGKTASGGVQRERRASGEGERGGRRASAARMSPGASRAAGGRESGRRQSTSALETAGPGGGGGGTAARGKERRDRASADRGSLAVHRGSRSDSQLLDKSPSPSRHSRSSQRSRASLADDSPGSERSHRRRASHEVGMRKGSADSSPSGSPRRHSRSAGHSPSASGHNSHHPHHHHQHRASRSGSLKLPASTSSSISLSHDSPTSKTMLLKQHALAQRGLSLEDVEEGEPGERAGEEGLAKPAAEMVVAGLFLIAGTSALVVSFASGGTTWTIVGSTFTGLGAFFLVIGICWFLAKTKDQEERVEIRVVDAKQLAQLIKQGVMVKQVQRV